MDKYQIGALGYCLVCAILASLTIPVLDIYGYHRHRDLRIWDLAPGHNAISAVTGNRAINALFLIGL